MHRKITIFLLPAVFVGCLWATLFTSGEAKGTPTPAQQVLQPFLAIPLEKKTEAKIGEGWMYSAEERSIHGYKTHYGVDFEAARGTPVLAAADGWAFASYHLGYAGEWKGKDVGFGLGNFVQIWHPDQGVFTSYAHLSKAEKGIPFIEPAKIKNKDGSATYDPKILYAPIKESLPKMKYVHRGDVIGYVGDSGLSWGYQEGPGNRPDPKKMPSWDGTHLHFEVYTRGKKGSKELRYDPFDHYADAALYKKLQEGKKGLWLTDTKGKILFADMLKQKKKTK